MYIQVAASETVRRGRHKDPAGQTQRRINPGLDSGSASACAIDS